MNSRSKNTGTRKSPVRAKKPATIDLEATEVKSAETSEGARSAASAPASTSAATGPASSKSATQKAERAPEKPLGRAGAKSSNSSEKKKPAETVSTSNQDAPSNDKSLPPKQASNNGLGAGMFGGVLGAILAVFGLGVLGQMEGASNLPWIGSIYAPGQVQADREAVKRLEAELDVMRTNYSNLNADELKARITALESGSNSMLAQELGNRLAGSEIRLEQLQKNLDDLFQSAGQAQNHDSGELSARLQDASTRLDTIETRLRDLVPQTGPDFSSLQSELSALSDRIGEIGAQMNENSSALASIQTQSSSLQKTVESVKASEKVARSVAVNALGAALENDDPITLAIASIVSLAGETSETRRLSELSNTGIPSQKKLLTDLAKIMQSVQNPVSATRGDTVSERFWANARNLVSFRSSGPQAGNTPVAILSRVKAQVQNGNLANAHAEWAKLPFEIRQAQEGWLNSLETRIEAFTLFESLSSKFTAQAG